MRYHAGTTESTVEGFESLLPRDGPWMRSGEGELDDLSSTCYEWTFQMDRLYRRLARYNPRRFMSNAIAVAVVLTFIQHNFRSWLAGTVLDEAVLSYLWTKVLDIGIEMGLKICLLAAVGMALVMRPGGTFTRSLARRKYLSKVAAHASVEKNHGEELVEQVVMLPGENISWCQYLVNTFIRLLLWWTFCSLIIWSIVLPQLFTSTLSIQSTTKHDTTTHNVPELDFSIIKFGSMSQGAAFDMAENSALLAAVYDAASRRRISKSQVSAINSSLNYSLSFPAPALQCKAASESIVIQASISHGHRRGAHTYTSYHSWVPTDQSLQATETVSTLDRISSDGARIYIMTNNGADTVTSKASIIDLRTGKAHARVNVAECVLYNATYSLAFTANRSGREVLTTAIEGIEYLHPLAFPSPSAPSTNATGNISAQHAYLAFMSAIGKVLVGTTTVSKWGIEHTLSSSHGVLDIDWRHADSVAVQQGIEAWSRDIVQELSRCSWALMDDTQGMGSMQRKVDFVRVVDTWFYAQGHSLKCVAAAVFMAVVCCLAVLRSW